jgi:hypothetical protein
MALTKVQVQTLLGLKESGIGKELGIRPEPNRRVMGRSGGPTPPPRPAGDRRRGRRQLPRETAWSELAVVRPGTSVRLVDVSRSGVLLESATRLPVDVRTELQLTACDTRERVLVVGRIRRCSVAALNPVRFKAAMEFDEVLPQAEADRADR